MRAELFIPTRLDRSGADNRANKNCREYGPVQEHDSEPVVPLLSEVERFGVMLDQSDNDGKEPRADFNGYECSQAAAIPTQIAVNLWAADMRTNMNGSSFAVKVTNSVSEHDRHPELSGARARIGRPCFSGGGRNSLRCPRQRNVERDPSTAVVLRCAKHNLRSG